MPSSPENQDAATAAYFPDESSEAEVVLATIRRRRMVRAFDGRPVESATLDALIAAAHAGPSAGNTRSLEVLVLTGARVLDYWGVTLAPDRREQFPWPGLLDAPVLMVAYVDPESYVARYGEPDKAKTGLGDSLSAWPVPFWWVDGGAAVENVLLAATATGLGACFFGQFKHEDAIKQAFGVPSKLRALGTIAIGHPDDDRDRPSASASRPGRPIADLTHWDSW